MPLLAPADSRFVSLTAFRRSGAPVSTPVWVGRDGESLLRNTDPIASHVVLGIERLVGGLRGRPRTPRLALRITAA